MIEDHISSFVCACFLLGQFRIGESGVHSPGLWGWSFLFCMYMYQEAAGYSISGFNGSIDNNEKVPDEAGRYVYPQPSWV